MTGDQDAALPAALAPTTGPGRDAATDAPAGPPRAVAGAAAGLRLRRALAARTWLFALLLLLLLGAVNARLQPNFLEPGVLVSNLATFLPLIVLAIGQTWVVLGGSIDLSLGAVVSLVNVVVVVLAEQLGNGPAAVFAGMAAGLAVGTLCGAANGLAITTLRLQPIVTTFATAVVYGGLALLVLPQASGALPDFYYLAFAGSLLGVPVPLILLALILAGAATLGRSPFQTHLLALGGAPDAAFQTGLPVGRLRVRSHALGGFMAAVGALCILGSTGAGDPLMGQAFTLGSVSAVVLGGTALGGGWGGVVGSAIGAVDLGLIGNVIFFADIDYAYQSVVQGVIVLVALAVGVFVARRPR